MRHSTVFGFAALLLIALGTASALAIIGQQRVDDPAETAFTGGGVEGYSLSETIGGALVPTTPIDVAIDANGRVFVADIGLNRVLAFTANGVLDRAWGEDGMSTQLSFPTGLALGPDGALYVLQLGTAEVRVLDSSGDALATWQVGGSEELSSTSDPVAIAVDGNGIVYLPDQRGQQIRRYESDGDAIESWSFPLEELGLNQIWPRDIIAHDGQIIMSYSRELRSGGGLISFDSAGSFSFMDATQEAPGFSGGSLAVARNGNLVQLYLAGNESLPPLITTIDTTWQPQGIETLTLVNGLVAPGIAYDGKGQLLVVDPGAQRIRVYSEEGAFAADIESPNASDLLGGLDEILAHPNGLLYAADPLRGRVVAYNAAGAVEAIYQPPDDPDAPISTGFTRQRMRMTVDSIGAVYIIDEFTGRVTKFSPEGIVLDPDWGANDDPDNPTVAVMLAAGEDDTIYLVTFADQDRIQLYSPEGEHLGVLVEPFWNGAIQDLAVAGDTIYTVELGLGSSAVRSFTTDGDYLEEIVDLSRGDGNSNRTGFALAPTPDGDLLIGAVNVSSGPEFEYQLLRLGVDGNLRRIGALDVPFTTLPDITVAPDGTLYVAAPNDQQIYVYGPGG